jgi:hypothetical protein
LLPTTGGLGSCKGLLFGARKKICPNPRLRTVLLIFTVLLLLRDQKKKKKKEIVIALTPKITFLQLPGFTKSEPKKHPVKKYEVSPKKTHGFLFPQISVEL